MSCTKSQPRRVTELPEGTIDFVISISTKQTSLSPLLIGDLLKNRGVDIAIPTHIHSSCETIPETLQAYGKTATGRLGASTTSKVFLTIVLKEGKYKGFSDVLTLLVNFIVCFEICLLLNWIRLFEEICYDFFWCRGL